MKKQILSLFVIIAIGFNIQLFAQQGKFKGIVKYEIMWEGEVPPNAPKEFDVKLFEQKTSFFDMFVGCNVITNAENSIIYSLFDFSQFPVEGVTGKWYLRNKIKPEELAKTSYDYTSETKEIAGRKVKKVNVVMRQETGDMKESIWVCDEIGPNVDMRFYPGLKAVPFEFPVEVSDKLKATFKAKEVIEGKVKEVDMLLPTGYEEVTVEEFQEIVRLIQEAMGQAQGAGDDI